MELTDSEFDILLKNALSADDMPSDILNARLKRRMAEVKPVLKRRNFTALKSIAAALVVVATTTVVLLDSGRNAQNNLENVPGVLNLARSVDVVNPAGVSENHENTPVKQSRNSGVIEDNTKNTASTEVQNNTEEISHGLGEQIAVANTESDVPAYSPDELNNMTRSVIPPEEMVNAGVSKDEFTTVMSTENVTNTGCSIVFEQIGTIAGGEIVTGSAFELYTFEDGYWSKVKPITDGEIFWTMIAHSIAPDSKTNIETNWEYIYGELKPGKYKIEKEVIFTYPLGEKETKILEAVFEING